MKKFRVLQVKKEFAWTKWTEKDIANLAGPLIAEKKKRVEKIQAIAAEKRTFENTVQALERADEALADAFSQLSVLMNSSPSASVRAEAANTLTVLTDANTDFTFDEKTYTAIQEYVRYGTAPQEEEDKKLLEDTLRAYKRLGFEKGKKERAKVQTLFKQMNKISQDFDLAINNWRGEIMVTKEELEGTSEAYIASLPQKDGKYIVSTDYPSQFPFLASAKSEAKRRELTELVLQRGGKENLRKLQKLRTVRHQIATTLGYNTWADYQLEPYLAENPRTVRKAIDTVLKHTTASYKKEFAELTKRKKQDAKAPFGLHDMSYYQNILQKEKYSVDTQILREYFPLNHVLPSMLSLFSSLLGITFTLEKNIPKVHPDVFAYSVQDTKSKQTIGYLFLDAYPRDGKFSHAAAFQTRDSHYNDALQLQEPTVITLMCNFAKPTKGTVSLLSHYDVETLFHEFGHALHHMLSHVKYKSHSGFSVSRDFVETPSQLLEHWVWDSKILSRITQHYKTKKSLSKKDIANLVASAKYMQSFSWRKQMLQAILSLELYSNTTSDPQILHRELMKKYTSIDLPTNAMFAAGFGHLSDYGAGYYVYMYAKMYADDFVSLFRKHGFQNKKIGMKYRKEILEPGASRKEKISAEAFLGRPMSPKAFIDEITVNEA